MHFWSRSQIPQNADYSSASSVNEEEVLTSLKNRKVDKTNAVRLNKRLIEHNIPKAISQIENYLQVLKVAYLKISRKKHPLKSKVVNKEKASIGEPLFDCKPLQTIANCLKYIDDNSLDMNSSMASSVNQGQNSIGKGHIGNSKRHIEELNVSEITPEGDYTELLSKNDIDRSDYLKLAIVNDSKKAAKAANEGVMESFKESFSVPVIEKSKMSIVEVPAELRDSSQESFCRTEEGEVEKERLKFIKSIEEDLKRRLGTQFITEDKKFDTTAIDTTLKNTARFPIFSDELNTNSNNKESTINVESKRVPIRINLKSKKTKRRKASQEPLTFRSNTETIKVYSSYKNLINLIEDKTHKFSKQGITKARNTGKRVGWIDTNRAKSKLRNINQKGEAIKLKKNESSTSRTPILVKGKKVVHLKAKKNSMHPSSRTCRSYTILNNNLQIGSFISTEDRDTPSFIRSKVNKSKALSPSDSTQTTLEYYMKNDKSGKPFIHKKEDRSMVSAQEAVKLLAQEYQATFGKSPKKADTLIDYWKEYITSKVLLLNIQ